MSTSHATAYVDHLTRERRPPNTIAAARRVLRSLPDADTATREDVEAWWTTRAHLSPATRSNDLAILRTFYAWCRRWEHRDDDDHYAQPGALYRIMSPAERIAAMPAKARGKKTTAHFIRCRVE